MSLGIPNDLLIQLSDGTTETIKVTKRAAECNRDTAQSSEFLRVVVDRGGGVPKIMARRVLTKWKAIVSTANDTSIEPTRALEALEIVYDMGSQGDPLSYSMGNKIGEPVVVSKSRLFLERY